MSADKVDIPLPDIERRLLINLDSQIITARKELDDLLYLRSQLLLRLVASGYKMADEIVGQGRADESES